MTAAPLRIEDLYQRAAMLGTLRLTLEPIEPTHADALFDDLRDHRLYEFIDDEPPESVAGLRSRFAKLATRKSPDGVETWLNWAVRRVNDARYVGYVQATIGLNQPAQIAYVFFRKAWGNGYAREAVAGMLEHLRKSFGITVFRAHVDTRNLRSISLLEALSFERTAPKRSGFMGFSSVNWNTH